MRKKQLTKRQLNFFIKDERKAVKEYNRLGLTGLARDEKRHMKFFQKLKKKTRK